MDLINYKQSKEAIEDQKRDIHFYFVEDGQPGFSPERNKAVVDETIRKYEANLKKRQKQYEEKLRERADAVVTFLKSRYVDSSKPIEKYFGKKWMAHLTGMKIRDRLQKYYGKLGTKYEKERLIYLPE